MSAEHEAGVLHRFEDRWYAPPLDEYDQPTGRGSCRLEHRTFPILGTTPKGQWIQRWRTTDVGPRNEAGEVEREELARLRTLKAVRWVSTNARKRYAHPSEREALEAYVARKKRQGAIYRQRARDAREALALGEEALRRMEGEH